MLTPIPSLADSILVLRNHWEIYSQQPGADQFKQLTMAVNNFLQQCRQRKLVRLTYLCENLALQLQTREVAAHPSNISTRSALARKVHALLTAANILVLAGARSVTASGDSCSNSELPRNLWLIADNSHAWGAALTDQLTFFGFEVLRFDWNSRMPTNAPLAILFLPSKGYRASEIDVVRRMRNTCTTSHLFCLAVPELLDPMVMLLRAGADTTIAASEETTTVLAHVLDMIAMQDQEPHRILLVEDSATAIAMIRRTLSHYGIDSHAIRKPEHLLNAVGQYRPDLVLMDMHMPHYSGVEATRVLRQIPACQALPVVYLSSETDVDMQVAALRLGGDHFINKPFNPLLLATIVKTTIERYRAMQRSSMHDGLTGLLNHTASKNRLGQMLQTVREERGEMCVAMIDIDRFKTINDAHGHPVGDQVIRNLAWLLKGRLRTYDVIGRYGGEEFLVGLRGIGINEGYAVLDRIRADFARLPHVHATGVLQVSFSAGIASFPQFDTDQQLIDAADQALLRAKRNGRNRIETTLTELRPQT